MAITRSMTRNHNHDDDGDTSRRKRLMTHWSDLNRDLLFLIMMQLGVVDFFSFSGVCKSWRSLALSNKEKFMASRPPMILRISSHARKKECHLEDVEGRMFKTLLPRSGGRTCVGLTCGYLVLFGRKTKDFLLVNPITRHELHFPASPYYVTDQSRFRSILVSSPSSGWVLVILHRFTNQIWFSIVGSRAWNHVSSTFVILDLHAFKRKIYATTTGCLFELILYPDPKLTLLETKNIPKLNFFNREFVSSRESLYIMDYLPDNLDKIKELDFGEMKWVSPEKTIVKSALFLSDLKPSVAIKQELCTKFLSKHERDAYFLDTNKSEQCWLFATKMWYFPHDSLNVNRMHE